jgi:hypothetical protein
MRIDDKRALGLIRRPKSLSILAAVMGGETTMAGMAKATGCPISSVWRHVEQLQSIGLVRVEAVTRRAGRAVKHYVATAKNYFIPYELEDEKTPEDVVRRSTQQQVRTLINAGAIVLERQTAKRWGTVIYLNRGGSLVVRPDFEGGPTRDLLAPNTPAYLNFSTDALRLGRARAKALQRDLVALLKRYPSGNGRYTYVLSVMLAPVVGGKK